MGNPHILGKTGSRDSTSELEDRKRVLDDLYRAESGYLMAVQWAISKEIERMNGSQGPGEEEFE